jgi:hypothetical protein
MNHQDMRTMIEDHLMTYGNTLKTSSLQDTKVLEAIARVYNGTKDPKQALDEAAARSSKVLGW